MTEPAKEHQQAPRRRLQRSRRDRMIGGVCGGIARYLDVDPVIIRIAAVALALSGGVGVVLYVVSWIVMPDAQPEEEAEPTRPPAGRPAVAIALGAVLLGLGSLALLREWMSPFGGMWGGMWGGMGGGGMIGGGMLWPVLVVAAGALLLASAKR